MYTIRYIDTNTDSLRYIETINKDKANDVFLELSSNSLNEEIKALVLTIDIKFNSSNKIYTYFLDLTIEQLREVKQKYNGKPLKARLATNEEIQVIDIKYRTPKQLKAIAKQRGFSYSNYKALHGKFIK